MEMNVALLVSIQSEIFKVPAQGTRGEDGNASMIPSGGLVRGSGTRGGRSSAILCAWPSIRCTQMRGSSFCGLTAVILLVWSLDESK
jgi:hypothetical protein